MSRRISLLIPAFNEEVTVGRVIEELHEGLTSERMRGRIDGFELLVLDDGSVDSTLAVACAAASGRHEVRTFCHTSNQGLARAFRTLYELASQPWCLVVPADNQWPASEVVSAIAESSWRGALVLARRSPYLQYSWNRRALSWAYRAASEVVVGTRVQDPGAPKLVRTRFAQGLRCRSTLQEVEILMRARADGDVIDIVSVANVPRFHGEAKGASARVLAGISIDLGRLLIAKFAVGFSGRRGRQARAGGHGD